MVRWLVLLFGLVVLMSVACGTSKEPAVGGGGQTPSAPAPRALPTLPPKGPTDLLTPTATPPPGATIVKLDITGFFHKSVEVEAGTIVVWTNLAVPLHTTTHVPAPGQPALWDSGDLFPGVEFRYTFDKPGVYNYICTNHPDRMQGTITVK